MRGQILIASLLVAAGASVASAETIYAITNTHLVKFDTAAPGVVTTVGAFNLGANYTRVFNLAYNKSDGNFYGIGWRDQVNPNRATQTLVRINAATGAASEVASYGFSDVTTFESMEYNDALGSLVSARGNFFDTTEMVTISNGGAVNALKQTTRDNDHQAYDSFRNKTYSWDPNGVLQWVNIDLATGNGTDLGGAQNFGDGAYSSAQDAFFVYQVAFASPYFFKKIVTDGVNPISVTDIGFIGNTGHGDITGLAFIPTPGSLALLGVGVLAAARRRR
jgi:hypothetical protein